MRHWSETLGLLPLLLLLPLGLLGAACAGPSTLQSPRSLDAPLRSAARLWNDWFSPAAMSRDIGKAAARASELADEPRSLARIPTTAGRMLGDEPARLRNLGDDAAELLGKEMRRTPLRPPETVVRAIDPRPRLARLTAYARDPSHLLRLDRRLLGEPDDYRHRTDPEDTRPEASLGARLWRRLFP